MSRVTMIGTLVKKALQLAVFPGARNKTLPILDCVRIEAQTVNGEGEIKITGTDLEQGITVKVPCKGEKQEDRSSGSRWERIVDGRTFKKLCTGLRKGQDVSLSAGSEGSCQSLKIEAPSGSFSLPCRPDHEWPVIPEVSSLKDPQSFESDPLAQALSQVSPIVTMDESRFAVCGMLIQGSDVVGTDGHRLYLRDMREPLLPSDPEGKPARTLIPMGHGIKVACKMGQIRGSIDAKHAILTGSVQASKGEDLSVTVVTRLLEGTFPQYDRVIPQTNGRARVSFSQAQREEWIGRLKSLVCSARTDAVTLTIGRDSIAMKGEDPDLGVSEGAIGIGSGREGEPLKIGINRRYLVEALSLPVTDLWVKDSETQILIDGQDLRAVIMPMRL